MWSVVQHGLITIKKINTTPLDPTSNEPREKYVEKPIEEWTREDHVLFGRNQQALKRIMSTLDSTTYDNVRWYTNLAKKLWNKLIELSLSIEEIMENKLSLVMQ